MNDQIGGINVAAPKNDLLDAKNSLLDQVRNALNFQKDQGGQGVIEEDSPNHLKIRQDNIGEDKSGDGEYQID